MENQAEKAEQQKKHGWGQYALAIAGITFSVVLAVVLFLYWDEIQNAEGYAYLTGFLVSILGGITIIPVPSSATIFALAHKVNPIYLGIISGIGEAIGGITIYYTGLGGSKLWSKLQNRRPILLNEAAVNDDESLEHRKHSKWRKFYNRGVRFLAQKGGSWALFITAAFVWWIYYPFALAAGTFRMGFKRFFLISLAGKIIRGLIVALAGFWGLTALIDRIGG